LKSAPAPWPIRKVQIVNHVFERYKDFFSLPGSARTRRPIGTKAAKAQSQEDQSVARSFAEAGIRTVGNGKNSVNVRLLQDFTHQLFRETGINTQFTMNVPNVVDSRTQTLFDSVEAVQGMLRGLMTAESDSHLLLQLDEIDQKALAKSNFNIRMKENQARMEELETRERKRKGANNLKTSDDEGDDATLAMAPSLDELTIPTDIESRNLLDDDIESHDT
jgi:hypothetical protein